MRGNQTRLELLKAAEALFADRGVDSVSFREIAAKAGQGNHSAVALYFKSRHELINAVLERHSDPIQLAWQATLSHLRSEKRDDLKELVGLMVRTLVAKLDDPDGGAAYLLIVAGLVTSRTYPLNSMPAVMAPGIMKMSMALMKHIAPIPPQLMGLRMMRVAAVLYCSIADYQRLASQPTAPSRESFEADLIRSLVGLISA